MAHEHVVAFPHLAAVPETKPGERNPGFSMVQDYLARFGYLNADRADAGVLDDRSETALKRFQHFFGLEETGVFDDATRAAMMQPRCALPDTQNPSTEFATTCAWPRRNLTFAFDTGTNDVPGTAEFDAVRRAFASWQALGRLTFQEVAVGNNPDIRVGWRPAADPDHSMVGGVLAHADFPPGCSIITNTLPLPVHFDDSEHVWSIGAVANAFDIETIALHELGHIMGLAHSSVANSVMLPTVSSNFTKRALTADDIAGFNSLYPAAPAPPAAWSGWNSQGGVLTSNITVARNADGRLEAFVRGTDGAVWHKWQVAPNGAWSNWNSQGGVITSDIAVGRNADGRLEIFARGTDNALWHKWQMSAGGAWSGWNSQGGVITTPPAVGINRDGRLEVFARGTDNALWHKWQGSPGGAFSGWNSQGGVLTSNIAVESNLDGRLEVFVRGTDNALWHKWQGSPGGAFSGWNSQGGVLTSNITVARNADGRLEVFVRGTDNALWHKWQQGGPGGAFSGWASRGGVLTSDIAVGRNQSGRLEAFVRGTDNALWHIWQLGSGGWSGWASEGGVLTSNIAIASNQDGRIEVFVRGTDNALWHKWQNQPFITADEVGEYQVEEAAAGSNGNGHVGEDMPAGAMAGAANAMPDGAMTAGGGVPAAAGDDMPTGAMSSDASATGGMPSGEMGETPAPAKTAAKRTRRTDNSRAKATA